MDSIYGYEIRDPYRSELAYFESNPTVSGMATEDNKIILNPYSNLTEGQYKAVAQTEAARLYMKENKIKFDFEITPEQRSIFSGSNYKDSFYSKDDNLLRQTIISRHIVGDPSAGKATLTQRKLTDQILEGLRKRSGSGL